MDINIHVFHHVDDKIVKALKGIAMNMTELKDALSGIGDELQKATDEIVTAIQNAGKTTPEVDAAVERLQAAAKALDDLNPDAPAPTPAP